MREYTDYRGMGETGESIECWEREWARESASQAIDCSAIKREPVEKMLGCRSRGTFHPHQWIEETRATTATGLQERRWISRREA